MTTAPTTTPLVAFLERRLAEDEAAAREAMIPAHNGYKPHPDLAEWMYAPDGEVEYVQTPEMLAHKYPESIHVTCDSEGLTPSRVLAEVASKRAVVALHDTVHECPSNTGTIVFDPSLQDGDYGGPCDTLRHLAVVYSDNSEYDESWRP